MSSCLILSDERDAQGALLFVGLLVLLWVPLLIFSTGTARRWCSVTSCAAACFQASRPTSKPAFQLGLRPTLTRHRCAAGNPTFQTPGIQAFAVNASIGGADDRGRAASFPLWSGGGRRVLSGALANDTLPPGLEGQYTADQIRLMCVAEVGASCSRCGKVSVRIGSQSGMHSEESAGYVA